MQNAYMLSFQMCKKFNNFEALQVAKTNVLQYYPVVGVLEMFNETLNVLEHKLPRYFRGSTKVSHQAYRDAYGEENYMNQRHKKPVSDHIKAMIRRNMTYEVEFYQFCKKRLQQQYNEINQLANP